MCGCGCVRVCVRALASAMYSRSRPWIIYKSMCACRCEGCVEGLHVPIADIIGAVLREAFVPPRWRRASGPGLRLWGVPVRAPAKRRKGKRRRLSSLRACVSVCASPIDSVRGQPVSSTHLHTHPSFVVPASHARAREMARWAVEVIRHKQEREVWRV